MPESTTQQQVALLLSQVRKNDAMYLVDDEAVEYESFAGSKSWVNTDEARLASEPAVLLAKLYAGSDERGRAEMLNALRTEISADRARVIVRTFVAIGRTGMIATLDESPDIADEVWRGLIQTLRIEPTLFAEQDLADVERQAKYVASVETTLGVEAIKKSGMRGDPRYTVRVVKDKARNQEVGHIVSPLLWLLDEAKGVIQRIRYLRLAKTIHEGVTPSISADRAVLISRLELLGFPAALSKALNEVERKAELATTPMDMKIGMDLLRTFYEEFTEEACRKIESRAGTAVPTQPRSHYQPYREYLKNAGVIDPDESELLQKLYNFLSNQGAHKLGSKSEQLLVAHVTVLEWSMLIAGRVIDLLKGTAEERPSSV